MPTLFTRLNQVLTFTNVAPGAVVSLPHEINVNGLSVKPDLVFRDNENFSIVSCTTTALTVQNLGLGAETLNTWLWRQHTIDRAYGSKAVVDLVPQPFIPAAGGPGGGGGGNQQAFSYTVTGLEPDLANLVIPLPAARLTTNYLVFPAQEQASFVLGMNVQTASKALGQFVLTLTAAAVVGDIFVFDVIDPT